MKQMPNNPKIAIGPKLLEHYSHIIQSKFSEFSERLSVVTAKHRLVIEDELKKKLGFDKVKDAASALNLEVAKINDKIVALESERNAKVRKFLSEPRGNDYVAIKREDRDSYLVDVETTSSFEELVNKRVETEGPTISASVLKKLQKDADVCVALSLSQTEAVETINKFDAECNEIVQSANKEILNANSSS